MRQARTYKIDLTKIEGEGDLSCPNWENKISPDDDTEKIYCIIESKADRRGLKESSIRCNRCRCRINLTGFSLLHKIQDAVTCPSPKMRAYRLRQNLPLSFIGQK